MGRGLQSPRGLWHVQSCSRPCARSVHVLGHVPSRHTSAGPDGEGTSLQKSLRNRRAGHRAQNRATAGRVPSRAPRCPPVEDAAARASRERANTFPEHSYFPRKHVQHLSCLVFFPNVWHSFQRKFPICAPSTLPPGQQARGQTGKACAQRSVLGVLLKE